MASRTPLGDTYQGGYAQHMVFRPVRIGKLVHLVSIVLYRDDWEIKETEWQVGYYRRCNMSHIQMFKENVDKLFNKWLRWKRRELTCIACLANTPPDSERYDG